MKVFSLIVVGVETVPVEIEIADSPGFSGIHLLGIPTEFARDMRERIKATIETAGLVLPMKRIIVNPLCAKPFKYSRFGYAFLELPICVAVWAHLLPKPVQIKLPTKVFFLGETTLSGTLLLQPGFILQSLVQRFCGQLPSTFSLLSKEILEGKWQKQDFKVQDFSKKEFKFNQVSFEKFKTFWNSFANVQSHFRTALMISFATRFPLFVVGSPGLGKTRGIQLACNLLLPSFCEGEEFTVSLIHGSKIEERPVRSPHHSVSSAALIGGQTLQPGEITLAHRGVLFLDELGEFSRHSLESLRESMETKEVHLSKSAGQVSFPADFQLVAAANPCACGKLFSFEANCLCAPTSKRKSLVKLSGPFMDRFFLRVVIDSEPFVKAKDSHQKESQPKDSRLLENTFESLANQPLADIYSRFLSLQQESYSNDILKVHHQHSSRHSMQVAKLGSAFESLFESNWLCLPEEKKLATIEKLRNYDEFLKLASK